MSNAAEEPAVQAAEGSAQRASGPASSPAVAAPPATQQRTALMGVDPSGRLVPVSLDRRGCLRMVQEALEGTSSAPAVTIADAIRVLSGLDLRAVASEGLIGRDGADGVGQYKQITLDTMLTIVGAVLGVPTNSLALDRLVQATAQGKFLGRKTAGAGNWEEAAFDNSTLEMTAGAAARIKALGVGTSELAAQAVTDAKRAAHTVEAHTADDTLSSAECHTTHSNAGAGGAINLTLPTAAAGLKLTFAVKDAQYLKITAGAGDEIRVGKWVSVAAGYLRSNTVGAVVTLEALDATTWLATYSCEVWWLEDTSSKEMPVGPPVLDAEFGDGSWGDAIYDTGDARWEDANGSALTTYAGRYTVSGATLTLQAESRFRHVTVPTGGILLSGPDCFSTGDPNTHDFELVVRGRLTTSGTGIVRSPQRPTGYGLSWTSADKTTAGNGNQGNPLANANYWSRALTGHVGGGSGGGSGNYSGASSLFNTATIMFTGTWNAYNGTGTSAGPGASTGAFTLFQRNNNWSLRNAPRLPGSMGSPGGGGACGNAGGSNKGSGGGSPGWGGGPLFIRAAVIDNAGTISAAAANGGNASDAVASNANGDRCGAGGGGSGGGGGIIGILYFSYTNTGTVSAPGGTGGTGGKGKRRFDDDTALTAWATGTAYALRDLRRPTAANGYGYSVSVAGTSHATTEPTWPTTPGLTVVDGTVTWVCVAEGSNQDDASGNGGNGGTGAADIVITETLAV